MEFIEIIEEKLGIKAEKNFVALGKGEVVETYADNSLLKALTGYHPKTSLPYGVEQLVGWYVEYSKVKGFCLEDSCNWGWLCLD